MTTLNYGLIGCGMMGQEHIRNIQLLKNAEVTAIFEPDEGMRAEASKLAPKAQQLASIDELLNIDSLNCLVITSPNFLHIENLKHIIQKRKLPILVEKPLFTDPEDEAFINQMIQDYDAPVWVAMEYRYMPPLAEFINRADAVTGGVNMLSIREHRFPFLEKVNDWNRFNRYSGGTLVEKCCHFFDLMRLVVQSEPVSVMASAGQTHNHLNESYDGETPDIWDNGYVIYNFENGSRALLDLCMFAEGSKFQEEISAVGVNGKIECLIPGPSRFWPTELGAEPMPKLITSPRHPKGPIEEDVAVDPKLLLAGDHHGSTYFQHEKFQHVVLGNLTPEVTLTDGLLAVKMGMAAQESALSGQVVRL